MGTTARKAPGMSKHRPVSNSRQQVATSGQPMWEVVCPRPRAPDGQGRGWFRVGVAFQGEGRITVKLDSIPVNFEGTLYLFPKEDHGRSHAPPADGGGPEAREPHEDRIEDWGGYPREG